MLMSLPATLATTLIGLLALQAGTQDAAQAPVPAAPIQERSVLEPLSLVEPACAAFDEAGMRARLLGSDLVDREHAYEQLLPLARKHAHIRRTIAAWSRDERALELAWTARLLIRELQLEASRGVAQVVRIEVHDSRPWQRNYQEQLLVQLGLDPSEYRVRGVVRVPSEEAGSVGYGSQFTGAPGALTQLDASNRVEQYLGVVCNEKLLDRVILTRVVPGSIADSIGLDAGDQLVRVAGRELTCPTDVSAAMHIWNTRPASAEDALEVVAIDAHTGETKTMIW